MSAESEVRAILTGYAPLIAACPAERIAVDTVDADCQTPYIVFSKQADVPNFGLDNTLQSRSVTIAIQVVGSTRAEAISTRELVEDALLSEGLPWTGGAGGYDPEAQVEAEVLTVDWVSV